MDNTKIDTLQNRNLLLDVRNQDEIDTIKYNINDGKYKTIFYMPSNIIKYNLDFLLSYFKEFDNVYIICKSGTRSKKIKDKYFANSNNVYVNPKHFNTLDIERTIQSPGLHLSITRKIQIISGSIILFLFTLLLFYDNVKYIYLFFGLIMLYVGISGNCFMSSILTKDDI